MYLKKGGIKIKIYKCKDTGEVVYTYKEYLRTKHWKNIKKRYKKSKLIQKCYICGSKDNLNLHHKSYKRIGKERLNDLIPLCRECHYLTHQALKKGDSINLNLWNIARRVKKSKGGKYSLNQLKKEYSYVAKKNNKKKYTRQNNKIKKVKLMPNDDLLQEDSNLYQKLIDEKELKITNVLNNEYEINNKYLIKKYWLSFK